MNFVGSYLKNVCQGGWGYVIRDSTGWILHQFLGSIACDDANEALVYAMLMGCLGLLATMKLLKVILFQPFNGVWLIMVSLDFDRLGGGS